MNCAKCSKPIGTGAFIMNNGLGFHFGCEPKERDYSLVGIERIGNTDLRHYERREPACESDAAQVERR